MPPLPLDSQDPRELGQFRLLGRLGEGGQGIVFLGEDRLGQKVAVKVLKAGADATARGALRKEMAAAQRVAKFCTARVIEASADGPRPFVVSEYVDGPSLEDRVAAQGPLAEGELDRLVVNTASALRAIHAAGVVHRDLKPANVLLGPDGPRVVDFGIARQKGSQTLTGRLVGTPAYMAPEQFEGRAASYASDVFAWAGTMAFAATGRPPFGEGSNIAAIMRSVVGSEPDVDGVPDNLLPLIRMCLAKDPDERPTARDLLDLLLDPGAGMAADEDLVRTMRTARRLPAQPAQPPPDRLVVGPVGPDGVPEDILPGQAAEPAQEPEPNLSIPPGSSIAPAPYPAAASIPPVTAYSPAATATSSEGAGVTAADLGTTIPPGARHVAAPYQPGVLPPPAPPPAANWNNKPWPDKPRRRGPILAGAAVAAVAVVGAAVWLLLPGDAPGRTDSPTIPAKYGAMWQGTVDSGDGQTSHKLQALIILYAGRSTGNAEFRDLACDGTLTLTGSGPGGLTFQLTGPSDSCPTGNVDVHFSGANLVYHLLGPNGLTQNGDLTRSQ